MAYNIPDMVLLCTVSAAVGLAFKVTNCKVKNHLVHKAFLQDVNNRPTQEDYRKAGQWGRIWGGVASLTVLGLYAAIAYLVG